ncbi:LysM peptidoglycan-binding domain-containing protein [Marinobacter panjinensis]|uniref:LysM peptidoglycan-binding domain-containing protein n=1 Tax=Marinobacter panjinensis TaxID=2576384 RepID=A0A4U6QRB9_9GAMM|nr:LysM domain-containing protein [Marinobacter panjinensis]MCR8916463.1 LysM peptidoglycan-binding domain-containing protein [Marinobacter panjinensis]TKV63320.1 LysM peptidoglycan-binding domain-containing protein [Marinobacter panjinensis]
MPEAYEVHSGDTLSAIAQRHRASLARVLNLNPEIQDPNRIFPGQTINVPAANELITSSCEPAQVVEDAPCGDKIAEVVHVTGSDELILLTEDELTELEAEEEFVCGPLNEYYRDLDTLAEENQGSKERPSDAEGKVLSPVQERKDILVWELVSREVIPQGVQSTPPLTEIKRLAGGNHYTYVRSEKIANHVRRYPMGARDRKRSKGWLSREGVDPEKLREAIESELNIKFNMSWSPDADNPVVLALNQYYDEVSWSIWGDEQAQQENRDRTGFDASAEAQFMRFAAGSSASGEFNPRSGKVHFQGKAEAQFSLLEGKASIEQAFPTNNCSEIRIYYRVGGWDGERTYTSLGHFQARMAISATGFAGASALLAANVHVDSTQGLPTLKGIAAREHGQGANLEANVFAGVRGGCEVAGSLLWVDTLATHSDWKPLCQIGKKVEAAAGVGVEGELRLEYNQATGKFYFNLHAGLVLGVGPSGNFLLEVDVQNTLEMIHFVYKALGDSDYRYLELFDQDTDAFGWYKKVSVFALAQGISHAVAIGQAAETASVVINHFWQDFIDSENGFFGNQVEAFLKERRGLALAKNVLADMEKLSESVFYHSPPEVKGAILHALMADFWLTPQLGDGTRTKVRAVAEILASFQAWRDFEETMKRINAEGRAEPQTFDRNVEGVFRFIGFNQHRYQLYKRALEFKTADLEQVVRHDPHGACRISGIV